MEKDYSKINLKKELSKKEKILLLALSKDGIKGYLLGSPPYGGITFINWLGVKNSFQKKGIGSLLLKKFEKIIKEKKDHKIHIWANKRACRFYKRNGYKPVGFISNNFFGVDDWLFYKKVRGSRRYEN